MAQRASKATKNPVCTERPSAKRGRKPQQSAEKRLSAILDAMTEEIIATLEHNYEPKER